MKQFIILFLLFGSILSYDLSNGQIQDDINNQQYQMPFQCGSLFYVKSQNKCVESCPPNFTQGTDANSQKICIDPPCAFPSIFDFVGSNPCVSDTTNYTCSYLVQDKDQNKVCLNSCPTGFSFVNNICKSNDENFSWINHEFLTCTSGRDFTNLTCLTNSSQCTSYYLAENNSCYFYCSQPYSNQVNPSTNQKVCSKLQFDITTCASPNYIQTLYGQFTCYKPEQSSDIKYMITDSDGINVNFSACPTGFTEGLNVQKGYKTCTSQTSFKWKDSPIFNCDNGYVQFSQNKCLSKISDCNEYFDPSSKTCVKECPDRRQPITEKNGKKICGKAFQNPYGLCKFPNIPYISHYNFCLLSSEKDKCDLVLVKDSIGNYVCLNDCPKGFTDTSTDTQKSCSSPSGFTWHNSRIIDAFDGKMDYINLKVISSTTICLDGGYYVKELESCFKSCPPTFSIGNNPNITFKYCVASDDYQKLNVDIGEIMDNYDEINKPIKYYPDSGEHQLGECKEYLIKDENGVKLCWPKCPKTYTVGKDQSTGQNTCTPPSGVLIKKQKAWSCSYPKVSDFENFDCLNSFSDCKTIFDFKNYACVPKCINKSLQINDGRNANICKYTNKCYSPNAFSFLNLKCLPSIKDCKEDYLISDSGEYNMCVPECPPTFTKGYDSQNQINSCTLPSGTKFSTQEFVQCAGSNIKDFMTGKCLPDVSQCQGYYVQQLNACLTKCPLGYSSGTDPSGRKICNRVANCVSPQVLNVQTQTCLQDISQCTGVYNQQKNTCEKECQANFSVLYDDNLKINICIPCPYKDDSGKCYEKCPPPLFADSSTSKCLKDINLCKGYYTKSLNTCTSSCPYGFSPTDTTDPKTCVSCQVMGTCESLNSNNCSEKLSSDKLSCSKDCPFREMYTPKQGSQTFDLCQKCTDSQFVSVDGKSCVSNCGDGQAIDKQNAKCTLLQLCEGVIFKESSKVWCLQKCPQSMQTVEDQTTNTKICKTCDANTYFDILTQKCTSNCTIFDASKTYCLRDINDCKGYISSDKKKCLLKCEANEKIRPSSVIGQFECVAGNCNSKEFYFEKDNLCLFQCPNGFFGDTTSNKCSEITQCKGVYSFDGLKCLDACPQGLYPDSASKKCKICTQKVSSDGLKCDSNCSGNEIYDLDKKQCVNPDGCNGKIISADAKTCSQDCQKGYLLSTDSNGKRSCLVRITDCTQKISSDFKSCVDKCNSNEAEVTKGSNVVCVYCSKGVSQSDKTKCNTDCDSSSVFDVDKKDCITKAVCGTRNGYVSANNKLCVQSCIFPDVKKSGDTKNCYEKCDSGQAYHKTKGCLSVSQCSTDESSYVSSDGQLCVSKCSLIMEAIDESATNPKKCKKCKEDEVSQLKNDELKCVPKSDNNVAESSSQAKNMNDLLSSVSNITPELKNSIKSEIQNISKSIESSVKESLLDSSLTKTQKNEQLKSLVNKLQDIANSFISKVVDTSSTTGSSEKLSLGNEQFTIVSEKKQAGKIFVTKFNLNDFLGAKVPDLQKDASSLDLNEAVSSTNASIQTLSTTNLNSNPYCEDIPKCGSTGLFSIQSTTNYGRILADGNQQTYQISYTVSTQNIDKTICVSYDQASGAMSPSVDMSADKANQKITCTFQQNISLYYDSGCTYVNSSLCQSVTNKNPVVVVNNDIQTKGIYLEQIFITLIIFTSVILFY